MTGPQAQSGSTCLACGFVYREGSAFCGGCGASLATVAACHSCGSENPPGQRFCDACGAPLASTEASVGGPRGGIELPDHLARKASSRAASLRGERKQVTVLFADVVGSMELDERLDPERWRAIMDRFFMLLADAVHRVEGTVDKFTGDGIMALFGAPIAHEDHARRACFAALEMQREVGRFAEEVRRSDGIDLKARIGINSGEVVVGSIGEGGAMDYTAVGHSVGLAQRMESLADPGTAYLSGHAAALVDGYFALGDRGEFEVKGHTTKLRVHELIGVGAARGGLDVSRQRGFTRFVGRGAELAELDAALERAVAGDGAVVGIVAEAGVGKSRLCDEFVGRCRERGIAVYEAQCQQHERSLPLVPVLAMLRAYFEIEPTDSEAAARERIEGRLLALDSAFEPDLGLIFDFLAVPDPERPVEQMNPEARQRRLVGLITRIVRARDRDETVVNVIEDLHWIDPASEAFLTALIDAVPGTGSLVLTNFRPEYGAEWMRRSYYRQLPLTPLRPGALDELLAVLLGEDPSLDRLAELIGERTGGNPFFIEECVRDLAESGALMGERGGYRLVGEVGEIAVPAKVQAVLAARIDRLGEQAKATLQAAAAIGAEFGAELLGLALGCEERALDTSLRELLDGEFIHELGRHPEPTYRFSHPLTREVAYGSQLEASRAATHAAIAHGLQQTAEADRLDERAGLIAQHFDRAGAAPEAARWYLRAAGWAGLKDLAAASRHCERMRELDDRLGSDPEADRLRLAARMTILAAGFRLGADLEASRRVFAEGREIGERLGDNATLGLLHGLLGVVELICGGDVPEAVRLTGEALRYARLSEDRNARVDAGVMQFYPNWLAGRHADVLAALDEVVELTAEDRELGAGSIIADPLAHATESRSLPLSALGRFPEARRALIEGTELCRQRDREALGYAHSQRAVMVAWGVDPPDPQLLADLHEAIEIAETLGSSFSIVVANVWLGMSHLATGDAEQADHLLAGALETIVRDRVSLEQEPVARSGRGRALAALGELDRAAEEGEQGVRLADERGTRVFSALIRCHLAETLIERASLSDLERARSLLDEAELVGRELGQRPDVAKALLVRSRLADRLGDIEARDRDRAETLALARDMDARGLLAGLKAEGASVG